MKIPDGGKILRVEQDMEETKIKRWSKIIAAWTLLGAIFGTVFLILIYLSIIEEELSVVEHIDCYVNLVLAPAIFYGLWKIKPWGWRLTVISIPLTWLYTIFDISMYFQKNMGIALSMFLFIDAAILRFLFKPEVKIVFGIQNWSNLRWTITPLWLLGAFLASNYFFGDLVAVIFSLSLFLGLKTAKKYRIEAAN
jgi:hypothetical protein